MSAAKPHAVLAWAERHCQAGPEALRARVLDLLRSRPPDSSLPHSLAAAGREALQRVTAHPGGRSVALDLLAADALITLALLAQSEAAPERLDELGLELLAGGSQSA